MLVLPTIFKNLKMPMAFIEYFCHEIAFLCIIRLTLRRPFTSKENSSSKYTMVTEKDILMPAVLAMQGSKHFMWNKLRL